MGASLRFLGSLLATNLKASLALRAAFWVQVVFMLANNLIFFVMWWVYFARFSEVRGWRVADMAAIYGMAAGAFGLAVTFGAGALDLAKTIHDGDLDSVLVQPPAPLLQCVASRSRPSGWGDLVSAAVLLGLSGYVTPLSGLLGVVGIACGAVVFLSVTVLVQSIAFWAGDTHTLSRQVSEFLIVFSAYPKTIFTGALKVLLFTALPAGFITFLPVDLVRGFSWPVLGAVVGGAAAFSALAVLAFALGLRRYESGSRFGVRG